MILQGKGFECLNLCERKGRKRCISSSSKICKSAQKPRHKGQMMKITLLSHTDLKVCSHAIRTCWQSFAKSDDGGAVDKELIDRVHKLIEQDLQKRTKATP